MKFYKSNTNVKTIVGPFVDATTGVIPRVALTASCVEGIIFWETDDAAAPAPKQFLCTATTANANALVLCTGSMGFYELDIQATNINTRGRLTLALRVSSTNAGYCLPVWHEAQVLPGDYYDTYIAVTAGTAYKKFFDVATPTGTINSIPDAVPGAANGLVIAGANSAITFTGLTVTTAASFGTVAVTATMSVGKVAVSLATFTGIAITTSFAVGTTATIGSVNCGAFTVTSLNATGMVVTTALTVGALVATSMSVGIFGVTGAMNIGTTLSCAVYSTPREVITTATYTGLTVTTALAAGAFTATTMSVGMFAATTAFTVGALSVTTTMSVAGSANFTGIDATALSLGDLTVTSTASIAKFNIGGFVDVIDRAYQILNNKMTILSSTGATTLRNFADDGDMATTTVTEAAGVTERDHFTWI